MAYTPKWTNISAVTGLLQITFTAATTPNTNQITDFIEDVEDGMTKSNLGTQTTISGCEFDVKPTSHAPPRDTVGWWEAGFPVSTGGIVVVPPYTPIVSVVSGSVARNKAVLTGAADWDTLVCRDNLSTAADTDFMILYDVNRKTGSRVGYAFYFYNDVPDSGRRRLRGTWVYGHNISGRILREYATLKVAEKALMARMNAAIPPNIAAYQAGSDINTFINVQTEAWLEYINGRTEEIERRHFPVEVPIVVLQGA